MILSSILLPALAISASAVPPSVEVRTFRNPLKVEGADPWLTYHDGWYYLATTTVVDVKMRRARRLSELKDAKDQVVWKGTDPKLMHDVWAPEFHFLESGKGKRWYLYVTAGDGTEPGHRMAVAESAGRDPMGPYTSKGQLLTDPKNEHYAIDGTVIRLPDGRLYFVWCGRPSPSGQGLYVSKMKNPWTLEGERKYLDVDGLGSPWVREGPVALVRKGKVYLIYSTYPADTPNYCLGMTVADVKSDLADPASWRQHPGPVFRRSDENRVYGPGHNSFFRSPDGKEDWIVYHAKVGTAVTYADRTTRAQKFTWRRDGTPDFGIPLAIDTDIPVPSGEK
ncbi:MAG: family 43 glycosylhydrolase [Fimbriimonas sp.]